MAEKPAATITIDINHNDVGLAFNVYERVEDFIKQFADMNVFEVKLTFAEDK